MVINGELIWPPVGTAAFMNDDAVFNCTGPESAENGTFLPYTWQYNAMNQIPILIAHDCQVNSGSQIIVRFKINFSIF